MAGRVDVFDVLQVVADTVRDHSLLLSMAWINNCPRCFANIRFRSTLVFLCVRVCMGFGEKTYVQDGM